jgi:hypothetical protein
VFTVTAILPFFIAAIGVLTLVSSHPVLWGAGVLFLGLIVLKFFDEWLRFTLVASTRPVLFNPSPIAIALWCSLWWGALPSPCLWGLRG